MNTGESLEIVFADLNRDAYSLWQNIKKINSQFQDQTVKVKLYDTEISTDQLDNEIKKKGRFNIEIDKFMFRFLVLPSSHYSWLKVSYSESMPLEEWEKWVMPFVTEPDFCQAWISNIEYNYWQNATDPLLYELNNKSYEGLPMKSNGLPPPLEQKEIDISNNPSRRIIRDGYVESVGSVMWLGKPFWEVVKTNKSVIKNLKDKCDIKEHDNEVLQIISANECFTESSDIEIQEKLRNIIYFGG